MTPADETILKIDVLGRVKTPGERREQLLDEFEKSGLTGQKFAALVGIKYQTFATWAQKRRRARGTYPLVKRPKRLRWTQRQRKTIFGLLLRKFGAMLEKTADEHRYRPATLWRVTVESWLRCQGLIVVRQNKKVSTTFPKIWSQN